VKSKLRKLFLALVFLYANLNPASGLIKEVKSLEQLEDEGEVHLGV